MPSRNSLSGNLLQSALPVGCWRFNTDTVPKRHLANNYFDNTYSRVCSPYLKLPTHNATNIDVGYGFEEKSPCGESMHRYGGTFRKGCRRSNTRVDFDPFPEYLISVQVFWYHPISYSNGSPSRHFPLTTPLMLETWRETLPENQHAEFPASHRFPCSSEGTLQTDLGTPGR